MRQVETLARRKFSKSELVVEVDGKEFHLGYSRLNSLISCPKQYEYTYIKNIRGASNEAMRKGTAYHEVIEVLGKEKKETGDLVPLSMARKLARYFSEQNELSAGSCESVQLAVEFWWSTRYSNFNPDGLEVPFRIFRGGVWITGRIDTIEPDGWVGDHKFSYDTWSIERAQYGCQPVIYEWAALDQLEAEFNFTYQGFRYEIVRTFPTPLLQNVEIKRVKPRISDWWEDEINKWARVAAQGIYPAIPTASTCPRCFHKGICKPPIYRTRVSEIGLRDELEEDYD